MKMKRLTLLVLCGLVLSLGLSAVYAEDADAQPALSDVLKAYQGILKNGDSFLLVDSGKTLNLADINKNFEAIEGYGLQFPRFSLADLDQDGVPELILEEAAEGNEEYPFGFLVFHVQDGAVHGYEMVYRALMDLKADGTFSFSSGAADNGFGIAHFSPEGADIVSLVESQSGTDAQGNLVITYLMDNQPASEEAYRQEMAAQDKKPNAEWHDATDGNIQALLVAE